MYLCVKAWGQLAGGSGSGWSWRCTKWCGCAAPNAAPGPHGHRTSLPSARLLHLHGLLPVLFLQHGTPGHRATFVPRL